MSDAPRIFISHSHEDDAFCVQVISDVRAQLGEDAVWYDTSGGLHGSNDWWDRIVAEIKRAIALPGRALAQCLDLEVGARGSGDHTAWTAL